MFKVQKRHVFWDRGMDTCLIISHGKNVANGEVKEKDLLSLPLTIGLKLNAHI